MLTSGQLQCSANSNVIPIAERESLQLLERSDILMFSIARSRGKLCCVEGWPHNKSGSDRSAHNSAEGGDAASSTPAGTRSARARLAGILGAASLVSPAPRAPRQSCACPPAPLRRVTGQSKPSENASGCLNARPPKAAHLSLLPLHRVLQVASVNVLGLCQKVRLTALTSTIAETKLVRRANSGSTALRFLAGHASHTVQHVANCGGSLGCETL